MLLKEIPEDFAEKLALELDAKNTSLTPYWKKIFYTWYENFKANNQSEKEDQEEVSRSLFQIRLCEIQRAQCGGAFPALDFLKDIIQKKDPSIQEIADICYRHKYVFLGNRLLNIKDKCQWEKLGDLSFTDYST